MDGREFSLLLPEGKQVACKSPMLSTAIADAIRANTSRDARGLRRAELLHRLTGRRFEVPPGVGLSTLYAQVREALDRPVSPAAPAVPAAAKQLPTCRIMARTALQDALESLWRAQTHLPERAAEVEDLARRAEALLATLEPA